MEYKSFVKFKYQVVALFHYGIKNRQQNQKKEAETVNSKPKERQSKRDRNNRKICKQQIVVCINNIRINYMQILFVFNSIEKQNTQHQKNSERNENDI